MVSGLVAAGQGCRFSRVGVPFRKPLATGRVLSLAGTLETVYLTGWNGGTVSGLERCRACAIALL